MRGQWIRLLGMKINQFMARALTPMVLAVGCWLAFGGCIYDVPITEKPTRKVDPHFLGHWTSQDGKDKMTVSQYDDNHYVVAYDGDLYRAWSSDVAGTPFFSIQTLDTTGTGTNGQEKFVYQVWQLASDGTLHGRSVQDKIIPQDIKSSSAVRKLLEKNLKNLELLGDDGVFVKDK